MLNPCITTGTNTGDFNMLGLGIFWPSKIDVVSVGQSEYQIQDGNISEYPTVYCVM